MDYVTQVVSFCAPGRVDEGHHEITLDVTQDELRVVLKKVNLNGENGEGEEEEKQKLIIHFYEWKMSWMIIQTYYLINVHC